MRFLATVVACTVLLSACGGPSLSPEQKAQRAANIAKIDAALKTAQNVEIAGKIFRVATINDKSYALVELQGATAPYTVADVERAGARATGCRATFAAGILAYMSGDIRTVDLNDLRSKIRGRFNGWRVDLQC